MYTYICTNIYLCTHVYIYPIHRYICAHMCTYIFICTHIKIYTYTYIHIYRYYISTHIYTHVYIYICMLFFVVFQSGAVFLAICCISLKFPVCMRTSLLAFSSWLRLHLQQRAFKWRANQRCWLQHLAKNREIRHSSHSK